MRTAMGSVNDADEAQRNFTEAANYYLEAADMFPRDDEKHPYGFAFFKSHPFADVVVNIFSDLLWRHIGVVGLLYK